MQKQTNGDSDKRFYVNWVESAGRKTSIGLKIVTVTGLSSESAQKKAKLRSLIDNELEKIRRNHPEPDPNISSPTIFMGWKAAVDKEKEKKLNKLYEEYFAITGEMDSYLVDDGYYRVGQVLTSLPLGAMKIVGRPKDQ